MRLAVFIVSPNLYEVVHQGMATHQNITGMTHQGMTHQGMTHQGMTHQGMVHQSEHDYSRASSCHTQMQARQTSTPPCLCPDPGLPGHRSTVWAPVLP